MRSRQAFLAYQLPDHRRARRFVEIATTRPETLLGDTAVAVNPDDERYKISSERSDAADGKTARSRLLPTRM
ncbi:hypothetical protein [Eubacterium ramulus]|uniref:hypothetical protein n=1 Tax=Eubacterium ramulus TaxID=39490 RepID=UPI0035207D61